jgi:hypothetical protein
MWLSMVMKGMGIRASFIDVLAWLQASSLSHFVAKANHLLIAFLQILHVLGLILLLAPLMLIGLRVLGLVLREQPFEVIIGDARKLSLIGLSFSLTSGAFMFLSAPLHYYGNWAFDAKMAALLAAVVTYGLIFLWVPVWLRAHETLARVHVLISLALWILVCMAGRAIGFV